MRSNGQGLPWQRWFGWSLALAGLLQAALYAVATGPGLAGTSDSVIYLHAAGTLRTAGHLLNPDGSAYRYWPPFYPILLALSGGPNGARLLQGAGLLSGLPCWSRLGRRLLPTGWALVLPWALALSTPGLLVSKFVWGETVFLALVAGYAMALFQWRCTARKEWAALASGLGTLLPLARTAGFFVLLGVGIGLLGLARQQGWRQRIGVGTHLAVSTAGGLAWHVYALLLAAPSIYRLNRGWGQFFSSASDYGFVLARWLLPMRAAWRPELPGVWALVLVGGLAWLWPRLQPTTSYLGEAASLATLAVRDAYFRMLWAVITTFVVLLLVSTTFTRSASGLYDAERYASALAGPVLLLVLRRGAAAAAEVRTNSRARRWLRIGIGSALVLWLVYSGTRALTNALKLRQLPVIAWPAQAPATRTAQP